ncbi:MAG: PKD-like domain-containing protein [Bacteroidota bacterium]|nr:PKD-like domain-containing protein [Bacteroidota bacterium]MDP3432079.1 PKD-like domain-containing protein [Bacteroidota bacterium]
MKTRLLALFIFSSFLFLSSCTKDDETAVSPVATATPATQTITSGTATSIALTSTISGTTYSWTVVQSGVSGATPGSGTSIAQTLTVTNTVAGTATYLITPMANGKSGSSVSVTITVNPGIAIVTYTSNIKPLLVNSCTPCHVAGGSNPKWDNYATAKSNINGILDRVQRESGAAGFMPVGGPKLSAANIALLKKWVTDGLLEN